MQYRLRTRQPGTTERLRIRSIARFQAASAQYNNSLWNVHTINSKTFPAPRFYQIDTDTNTVVQSGVFFNSATSDDFNPSIAVNPSGEVFVHLELYGRRQHDGATA